MVAPIIKMKIDIDLLIDTEKLLLSALTLKNGVAIPEAAEILKPDDFYRPEHRVIYKSLLRLSAKGKGVNQLLVEEDMRQNGDLKKVTRSYLYGLIPLEYTVSRVPAYVERIKTASTYRKLATLGAYLKDAAENELDTPEKILTKVEETLTMTVEANQQDVSTIKELLLDKGEQILNNETTPLGIPTGFRFLDTYIGGLKKSDLIILAARPSMGKTALAMNIAAQTSRTHSVLIFSLEMSKAQLINRFLAADARVNATKINHNSLVDNEINSVLDSIERLSKQKLFIDDRLGTTLAEMKLKARRIKREHGLDLIIIDYLQLMQSEATWQGNRVQQVSEISRGLKTLARELDIPVLALSQLSRSVEIRADKRPMLSDLRESGSIEQDADIVMFLYRDEYYDRDDDNNKGLAEVIIAKNRNGSIGKLPFRFEPEYQSFSELTKKG